MIIDYGVINRHIRLVVGEALLTERALLGWDGTYRECIALIRTVGN
jgi:hypothetical protein